jgi:hypothetical protein
VSPYKRKLKRIQKRERGRAKAERRRVLQPVFAFLPVPKDPISALLAGLETASKK